MSPSQSAHASILFCWGSDAGCGLWQEKLEVSEGKRAELEERLKHLTLVNAGLRAHNQLLEASEQGHPVSPSCLSVIQLFIRSVCIACNRMGLLGSPLGCSKSAPSMSPKRSEKYCDTWQKELPRRSSRMVSIWPCTVQQRIACDVPMMGPACQCDRAIKRL